MLPLPRLGPEAKRLLASCVDNNVHKTLARRIALLEAIQELVQCRDLRKIDQKDRQKYYTLLANNDVEPSDSLKMKIIVASAEDTASAMVTTRKPEHMKHFLRTLLPFVSEESAGFDFFKPSVNSLVLEALAREDTSGSWDVKQELEDEDMEQPVLMTQTKSTDWQAPKVGWCW